MEVNLEQYEKVIELAKERSNIILNKEFVLSVMYSKKGRRLVATKVSELKELLQAKAKECGKKLIYDQNTGAIKNKQEAELIKAYTESLEKIVQQYDDNYKKILELKLKLEAIEISGQIIQNDTASRRDEYKKAPEYNKEQKLKEELKEALQVGNYEVVEEKNKELLEISKINKATQLDNESKNIRAEMASIKEEIEKCTQLQRECEEERRIGIQLITSDLLQSPNEKALMIVKRQGWARKSWNKFLNRINGDKRYTNYVINPLNKKIRDINYKNMPPIRKKINEKTEEIQKTANEKIEKLQYIDVTKENNDINKEEKTNIKTKGSQYRQIITSSRNKMGWRITKAAEQAHRRNKRKIITQTKTKETNQTKEIKETEEKER